MAMSQEEATRVKRALLYVQFRLTPGSGESEDLEALNLLAKYLTDRTVKNKKREDGIEDYDYVNALFLLRKAIQGECTSIDDKEYTHNKKSLKLDNEAVWQRMKPARSSQYQDGFEYSFKPSDKPCGPFEVTMQWKDSGKNLIKNPFFGMVNSTDFPPNACAKEDYQPYKYHNELDHIVTFLVYKLMRCERKDRTVSPVGPSPTLFYDDLLNLADKKDWITDGGAGVQRILLQMDCLSSK